MLSVGSYLQLYTVIPDIERMEVKVSKMRYNPNGAIGAGFGSSFKRVSFTIVSSYTSSDMQTTPSSASGSRGLSEETVIWMGIDLITILGIGA